MKVSGSDPTKAVPGWKTAKWSAGRAGVHRKGTRAPSPGANSLCAMALRLHHMCEGKETRAVPTPTKQKGADDSCLRQKVSREDTARGDERQQNRLNLVGPTKKVLSHANA